MKNVLLQEKAVEAIAYKKNQMSTEQWRPPSKKKKRRKNPR
jgi:hypothetical protein